MNENRWLPKEKIASVIDKLLQGVPRKQVLDDVGVSPPIITQIKKDLPLFFGLKYRRRTDA